MNDSPGWAPPGPSPSDEPDQHTRHGRPKGTADGQAPALPDQPGPDRPAVDDSVTDGPEWGAKWAERQPPAGHWTAHPGNAPAPPPTPPTGPAGPASYGNWGRGWTQPPPAARPGVIPLRPLSVGEILDGAVSTLRAHWQPVLCVSLVVALIAQGVTTAATGLWFRDANGLDALGNNPDQTLRETLSDLGQAMKSSAVPLAAGILGTLVTTALLTVVIGRAVLGRPVSLGEAWRDARPRLLQLCGLLLLMPALVAVTLTAGLAPGLLLIATGAEDEGAALAMLGGLAAAVAALWLWIRYSLAAPALMLEKRGIGAAMRRSAKLVRGAWWRVLGIQLLALLIAVVISAVIEVPTSLVGMAVGGDNAMDWLSGESATVSWTFLVVIGIGGVIGSTITLPIAAGITALIYVDQRIRREALDVELASAAGIPGQEK
ncbi:glycerophosphoryl diester phosphodiesterase membrane domain-containing protein [Streptomyces sp. NPDC059590]|uniref:glycerophosphoryl diester phosphodiesterase membrane domain-containing protein n=1 Tax=Streptomyces sp. NPDC059590 TaxID=3346877 RepID=UPI003694F8DA